MKYLIISLLFLVQCSTPSESVTATALTELKYSNDFSCNISSSKDTYKLGEYPDIAISITNKSNTAVNLIGSLDGSEGKRRYPYCYFIIEKPRTQKQELRAICGNMNSLDANDFVLVKKGERFNPYEGQQFFGAYEITSQENFKIPGIYKINFHYSTASTKIEEYMGDGKADKTISNLFKTVPNIDLKSNTIEIEITE